MTLSYAVAGPVDEVVASWLAPRNGFHRRPRCRVCGDDEVRKKVSDFLALIVRAPAKADTRRTTSLPAAPFLTWRGCTSLPSGTQGAQPQFTFTCWPCRRARCGVHVGRAPAGPARWHTSGLSAISTVTYCPAW